MGGKRPVLGKFFSKKLSVIDFCHCESPIRFSEVGPRKLICFNLDFRGRSSDFIEVRFFTGAFLFILPCCIFLDILNL